MNDTQDFYNDVDYFTGLLDKPTIIQNAVEVGGVVYRSRAGHDFVELPDGRAIDGGHNYLKRVGMFESDEDLSLTTESSWPEIYEKLTWGTYGIDGRSPLRWVRIRDMSISHIRNVLNMFDERPRLSKQVRTTLHYWLNRKTDYEEAVQWLAKNQERIGTLVSEPYSLLLTNPDGGKLTVFELLEELREALYYSTNALDGEK